MKKWMSTREIRSVFLQFFQDRGHTIVPSSGLVPVDDPTLLFTNAGMVQFKDTFLGKETRPYKRATSSQRCVRAGGKHNDLENVGYTARHHTFFEMLGNFSFGDYFKREAIQFAWAFLTEVLELPPERLWVTVFREDRDSENIWLNEMKISPQRFTRCGEKDNFWSMGDTGPCGPCTEIYFDHGPTLVGGPPGSPGANGDRFVEIWNLVFMQYERDLRGKLTPLPKPCVDTGMGLERISSVMQGVQNNFDTDGFTHLLQALSKLIGHANTQETSMRVIVDHIRSVAFLIMDGVTPGNEGRGYVLRRIMRRAIRHGHKLGTRKAFFYQLVPALVEVMGDAYPELKSMEAHVMQVIAQEEAQFDGTLNKGMKMLEQTVTELRTKVIPGEIMFQLYDTYGFPPDLTADIARERGLEVDYDGFNAAMERQRKQSQQASAFGVDYTERLHLVGATEFLGYDVLACQSTVTTLLQDNKPVTVLQKGAVGVVVLDRTPFYAESGGQVGDRGVLYVADGAFTVLTTRKQGPVYLHHGRVTAGKIQVNDPVTAEVDSQRFDIMRNHTATHLLHAALRRLLGEHVRQQGSLVDAQRLRFDFSHSQALTAHELQAVEALVNQQIRANLAGEVRLQSPEEAKAAGAMALFGEKYTHEIRVLNFGGFSHEICGGTHVHRTGEIGFFKIVNETACAAGVRRIEAVTGAKALEWVSVTEQRLSTLAALLKTNTEQLPEKVAQLLKVEEALAVEIRQLKQQMAGKLSEALLSEVKAVQALSVLAVEVKNTDAEGLRTLSDQLLSRLPNGVIVLAGVREGKIFLIVRVAKSAAERVKAGQLLNYVATQVGGKGGGRDEFAQGGGTAIEHLEKALGSVASWVEEKIE